MTTKILLVEGNSDKKFFEEFCKNINLNVEIAVNTPTEHGAKKNGKNNGFQLLSTLVEQLYDGSITHLGMVVDADYIVDGWGYKQSLEKVEKILKNTGYHTYNVRDSGLSFTHSDGLNPFGLWIMPDNNSEGMLEDFLKKTVKEEEKSILNHSISIVENLPKPVKFKKIHQSKAEIATWLAWQEHPGEGPYITLKNSLIDLQATFSIKLINWLKSIYF